MSADSAILSNGNSKLGTYMVAARSKGLSPSDPELPCQYKRP